MFRGKTGEKRNTVDDSLHHEDRGDQRMLSESRGGVHCKIDGRLAFE